MKLRNKRTHAQIYYANLQRLHTAQIAGGGWGNSLVGEMEQVFSRRKSSTSNVSWRNKFISQ
jgi:hypothetical protein